MMMMITATVMVKESWKADLDNVKTDIDGKMKTNVENTRKKMQKMQQDMLAAVDERTIERLGDGHGDGNGG